KSVMCTEVRCPNVLVASKYQSHATWYKGVGDFCNRDGVNTTTSHTRLRNGKRFLVVLCIQAKGRSGQAGKANRGNQRSRQPGSIYFGRHTRCSLAQAKYRAGMSWS